MKTYKKLYWGIAYDGNRGACVVANSAYEARKLFAAYRGYYAIDVEVDRICRLPPQHQNTIETFPSDDLLKDCGIEFITSLCPGTKLHSVIKRMLKLHGGRVFKYNNRIYQEGNIP
jgi:hypothetical protein